MDDRKNIKVDPLTHFKIREKALYSDKTIKDTTEMLIQNGLSLEAIDNYKRESE